MIIEALVADPRRPSSTRVMVGGRPAWTVPADVVGDLRLQVGDRLGPEAVRRLDAAADEEGAFRAALRSLERRAHGKAELAGKLHRKGHPEPAVAAALARLEQLGLLDDRAFARSYVESRTGRGRGPVRLRHDLVGLGVSREDVEAVLAEIDRGEDPLARPRELVARRVRQLAHLPAEVRRRRLIAFLARRGYTGSEARHLVEAALGATG